MGFLQGVYKGLSQKGQLLGEPLREDTQRSNFHFFGRGKVRLLLLGHLETETTGREGWGASFVARGRWQLEGTWEEDETFALGVGE